jgi:hypothetical protein
METDSSAGNARGSDEIRGTRLASAAAMRGLTLLISGVPTVLAWALMSKRLDASAFSGVSLALALPTVSSFILPAMGARIANAVAIGPDAFHDAIVRSVRSCIVVGIVMVMASIGLSAIGWSSLLGRSQPDSYPMNAAVIFVSASMALWIVLLVGERILIARGEVNKRIWASAITGPVTLLGVLFLGVRGAPDWAYVLPIPCAMLLAALCGVWLAACLPEVKVRWIVRHVARRPDPRFGRSALTAWLLVVEASLVLPIWLLRPAVSVRGSNADVASLSVALQFAAPVLSILAVLGQALWPFYARNRLTLQRRDVLRHTGAMAVVSLSLAVLYAVALELLTRWNLIGHAATVGLLLAMGLYITARGAWEPARIVFSTDQTARALAGICLVTGIIVALLMWFAAGIGNGTGAVLAVTAAFGANVLIATMALTPRLQPGGIPVHEPGDDVSMPIS